MARREWRSAREPAHRVNTNSGMNCASPTMPTMKALSSIDSVSRLTV
ncbi:MAG: hypothetical protein ACD_54C00918G0001 [uncultured bacterium]|nr:MAG: hypothetical protein ACD_54C00918G0001 [uncultured bacterium]